MKSAVIVAAVRTPMGSFGGALSEIPATRLGAAAIKGLLERSGISPSDIGEVFMGMVLQGGAGQAPARQAARFAGIADHVPCTTINKVCASGMKAVMFAAQSVMLGDRDVVIAGGMENMSMTPFYLEKARYGYKLGNGALLDGLIRDGLTDVYNQQHMGVAAELCAREYKISREEQDAYAVESYERSAKAWTEGKFNAEVIPVTFKNKKGEEVTVSEDEEYKNVRFDKIPSLKPVFDKEGTVTAANASTLNDGASALLIMSEEKAKSMGLKPLARIVSYADAEQSPEWFTTSPAKAAPIALDKAGLNISQMDAIEINEAFSVVSLANIRLMEADASKVNINGGAVSLGHPLGSSGSRILVTLLHVLHQQEGRYGLAAICNGGGGASAVVIERL